MLGHVKTKPPAETLRKIKFCGSKPVNTIQLYIFKLFHSPNGETCNKMKLKNYPYYNI